MSKTFFHAIRSIMLCFVVLFVASCDNTGDTDGHSAVTKTISSGDNCEIVLRGDVIQGFDRMITPRHTSENINGSKDSVYGRILKLDKDWIAVSLADIRVETNERSGSVATFGTAGRLQEYVYYIPTNSVAYMRTWK